MKHKIEILAPAGSMEAMEAAIEAGCDAVYIGGSHFGARAYADNLMEEQLLEAIDYAHLRGKKLYLTVNTLLKERELSRQLYWYMEHFYRQGLDAAIVQDVGVLHFLHTHFPQLPLHASTQMTITCADALELLAETGVTRIVTSRELSFSEVRAIRQQTNLEIESFVHGALCYCYSGQCLFSSMYGGRSGNRGRCTQPCRMAYRVQDEKGNRIRSAPYVLSPKDMCMLEHIPELIESGINSFKIEGRMKRAEYAAGTTAAYRKWVDRYQKFGAKEYQRYLEKHPDEMQEDIRKLADLYNRGGFSEGYYQKEGGTIRGFLDMMAMNRPNHDGVEAVRVEQVHGNNMTMRALLALHAQDVIEIRKNGRPEEAAKAEYEFTLKKEVKKGETFTGRFLFGSSIMPGMKGFRTKNFVLLEEIRRNYKEKKKKLPLLGCFLAEAGKPMKLEIAWKQEIKITCQGVIPEPAQKQPVTEERVRQAFDKMGNSAYEWEELTIKLKGDLFFPMSAVNQLRREGLRQIQETFLAKYRRTLPEQGKEGSLSPKGLLCKNEISFSVSVETEEQLTALLEVLKTPDIRIDRVYLSMHEMSCQKLVAAAKQVRETNRKVYLRFVRIFRIGIREKLEREEPALTQLLGLVDGVLLHTMEEVVWMKNRLESDRLDIILAENMYIWNKEARRFWQERGIYHFTAPLELTEEELAELGDVTGDEFLLYGHIPLMVSAQCVYHHTGSCLMEAQEDGRHPLFLMNEKKRVFPVKNVCRFCYNILYQAEPINLWDSLEKIRNLGYQTFRIDFTIESGDEVHRVLLEKKRKVGVEGHFYRGVE